MPQVMSHNPSMKEKQGMVANGSQFQFNQPVNKDAGTSFTVDSIQKNTHDHQSLNGTIQRTSPKIISKESLETLNKDASDFRTSPPLDMLNNDARYSQSKQHYQDNITSAINSHCGSPFDSLTHFNQKQLKKQVQLQHQPQSPSRLVVKRGDDIIEILSKSSSGQQLEQNRKTFKNRKKIEIIKEQLSKSSALHKRMTYHIDQSQLSKEVLLKLPQDTTQVNLAVAQRNQFQSLTNRYGFARMRQSFSSSTPQNQTAVSKNYLQNDGSGSNNNSLWMQKFNQTQTLNSYAQKINERAIQNTQHGNIALSSKLNQSNDQISRTRNQQFIMINEFRKTAQNTYSGQATGSSKDKKQQNISNVLLQQRLMVSPIKVQKLHAFVPQKQAITPKVYPNQNNDDQKIINQDQDIDQNGKGLRSTATQDQITNAVVSSKTKIPLGNIQDMKIDAKKLQMHPVSPIGQSPNKQYTNQNSPISTKYMGSPVKKFLKPRQPLKTQREGQTKSKIDNFNPAAMQTIGHSFFASSFYSRKTNNVNTSSSVSPQARAQNQNKDLEREFSKSTFENQQGQHLSGSMQRSKYNIGMPTPAPQLPGTTIVNSGEIDVQKQFNLMPVVDKIKRRRLRDVIDQKTEGGYQREDISHTYHLRSQSSDPNEVQSDYSSVNYSQIHHQEQQNQHLQEPQTAALLFPADHQNEPIFFLESGQRTMEDNAFEDPSSASPQGITLTPQLISPKQTNTDLLRNFPATHNHNTPIIASKPPSMKSSPGDHQKIQQNLAFFQSSAIRAALERSKKPKEEASSSQDTGKGDGKGRNRRFRGDLGSKARVKEEREEGDSQSKEVASGSKQDGNQDQLQQNDDDMLETDSCQSFQNLKSYRDASEGQMPSNMNSSQINEEPKIQIDNSDNQLHNEKNDDKSLVLSNSDKYDASQKETENQIKLSSQKSYQSNKNQQFYQKNGRQLKLHTASSGVIEHETSQYIFDNDKKSMGSIKDDSSVRNSKAQNLKKKNVLKITTNQKIDERFFSQQLPQYPQKTDQDTDSGEQQPSVRIPVSNLPHVGDSNLLQDQSSEDKPISYENTPLRQCPITIEQNDIETATLFGRGGANGTKALQIQKLTIHKQGKLAKNVKQNDSRESSNLRNHFSKRNQSQKPTLSLGIQPKARLKNHSNNFAIFKTVQASPGRREASVSPKDDEPNTPKTLMNFSPDHSQHQNQCTSLLLSGCQLQSFAVAGQQSTVSQKDGDQLLQDGQPNPQIHEKVRKPVVPPKKSKKNQKILQFDHLKMEKSAQMQNAPFGVDGALQNNLRSIGGNSCIDIFGPNMLVPGSQNFGFNGSMPLKDQGGHPHFTNNLQNQQQSPDTQKFGISNRKFSSPFPYQNPVSLHTINLNSLRSPKNLNPSAPKARFKTDTYNDSNNDMLMSYMDNRTIQKVREIQWNIRLKEQELDRRKRQRRAKAGSVLPKINENVGIQGYGSVEVVAQGQDHAGSQNLQEKSPGSDGEGEEGYSVRGSQLEVYMDLKSQVDSVVGEMPEGWNVDSKADLHDSSRALLKINNIDLKEIGYHDSTFKANQNQIMAMKLIQMHKRGISNINVGKAFFQNAILNQQTQLLKSNKKYKINTRISSPNKKKEKDEFSLENEKFLTDSQVNILAQLLPEDINDKLKKNNSLLKHLSSQIQMIKASPNGKPRKKSPSKNSQESLSNQQNDQKLKTNTTPQKKQKMMKLKMSAFEKLGKNIQVSTQNPANTTEYLSPTNLDITPVDHGSVMKPKLAKLTTTNSQGVKLKDRSILNKTQENFGTTNDISDQITPSGKAVNFMTSTSEKGQHRTAKYNTTSQTPVKTSQRYSNSHSLNSQNTYQTHKIAKKPTFMAQVRHELAQLGDNLNIRKNSPKVFLTSGGATGTMLIPSNMQSLSPTDQTRHMVYNRFPPSTLPAVSSSKRSKQRPTHTSENTLPAYLTDPCNPLQVPVPLPSKQRRDTLLMEQLPEQMEVMAAKIV